MSEDSVIIYLLCPATRRLPCAYACTGGKHTLVKFPPSQRKLIVTHSFEFISRPCIERQARQRRAHNHWSCTKFRKQREALQSTNSSQYADTAEAPPNTAQPQSARTQIKQPTQIIHLARAPRALNIQHTFTTSTAPERGSSMAVEKNDSMDEAQGYGAVTSGRQQTEGGEGGLHPENFFSCSRLSAHRVGCALVYVRSMLTSK